jgi:hypothetical protein
MDAKTTTAAAIMRSLSKLKLPGTSPTLSSRQRGEEGPRGGCRSTRRMRPADSLLANLFTGASAVKAPYAQLKDPAGGSKDATAVGNTALSAHTEESGQPRARGDSSYRRYELGPSHRRMQHAAQTAAGSNRFLTALRCRPARGWRPRS